MDETAKHMTASLYRKNRVVITGAGVVCAAGLDTDAFFDALAAGRSGIGPIQRFDATHLATRIAGEVDLERLELPPASFLERIVADGRPPLPFDRVRESKALLAWNALRQVSSGLPASAGLIATVGLERVDLERLIATAVQEAAAPAVAGIGEPLCPEIPLIALPGRLWRDAGFTGPVTIQAAACAAGTIALGAAFRAIRSGRADCLVAGGVDSLLFPYGIHAFNSLGALSERNDLGPAALAPFDKNRTGTLLGEGSAWLVLENLDSAIARGVAPLAEIVGFGGSMDAHHYVMPDPGGVGAASAMRAALRDAGLSPESIGYVNAHGTGTPQNDAMECLALREVFGNHLDGMPVSSIKPFVGHLLTVAGSIEAVASLLPFVRGVLPPTLHFATPDPACPIDCVPNQARPGRPEYVMSCSYGLGGQNGAIIFKRP